MDDREHFRIQMMGFLDDELDDRARLEFVEQCYADPELAAELAKYRNLNDITNSMRLREPEDYEYERFFAKISARLERRLGFTLLFLGAIILTSAGLVALFLSSFSTPVKPGAGLTLIGGVLLVFSVARAWLRIRQLDRYRGVKR
ncbi:MAG: hypothetical protein V2A76_08915 [Planctomycetota bacterium]